MHKLVTIKHKTLYTKLILKNNTLQHNYFICSILHKETYSNKPAYTKRASYFNCNLLFLSINNSLHATA